MASFPDPDTLLHTETDLEEEDDRVSVRVRDLLTKRGVPIHKQGSELSNFLGVARSTIHRKFKNGGWSAAELRAVAGWIRERNPLEPDSPSYIGANLVAAQLLAEADRAEAGK